MERKKVSIHTLHFWNGWSDDNSLLFEYKNSQIKVDADYTVFALGGASWSKTGSDGKWSGIFQNKGINVLPFQPSNCAFKINWPENLITNIEGKWMKNISVSYGNQICFGEIVCTSFGLEGSPIYALNQSVREEIKLIGEAKLFIDLKPYSTLGHIQEILTNNNKSINDCLKNKIKLGSTEIELLKSLLSKEEFTNPTLLADKIKKFPVTAIGLPIIDEAISSVGGIDLNEVNQYFEFKNLKNNFATGEMLDWDAPTGGYLLQGCFSMGFFLGSRFNITVQ